MWGSGLFQKQGLLMGFQTTIFVEGNLNIEKNLNPSYSDPAIPSARNNLQIDLHRSKYIHIYSMY